MTSGIYSYRLKQIDFNGNFQYFNLNNDVSIGIPSKFEVYQNYPNPFNPSTKLNFNIPFDGKVNVTVFDLTGKEIVTLINDVKTAGYYTIDFNASNCPSGIYFYRIIAGNFTATKKMTLIK
ncbi:MAG: T9SS type A sorting domain-containing protein [Ignavibacteria bacterium]|nr:T9SS type A sorting domain-containing protein [Ignavibacteria bacterium]